ncbi:MAG: VOC family protein, partial [Planctomycetota bacterium]
DDVEAFLPTIRAADVPILDGPKRRPDGVTQLFVLDPDGHIIELS